MTAWLLALVPPGVHSVAVAGEGVAAMSAAIISGLGLPLRMEQPHWAVLAAEDPGSSAAGRMSQLPASSLDVVVVRRAWADRPEAQHLLHLAHRLLRPGGALVAAELDADTLLEGPVARYPGAALWRRPGAPADSLRKSSLSAAVLSTDAVAARFASVSVVRFDEMLGEHRSMESLWANLRRNGWRGDSWLSSAQRVEFFESLGPGGAAVPLVDREPWFAVTGVRL